MAAAPSTVPAPALQFIDIGVNLSDGMFNGRYHGKKVHADDFDAMLQRAKDSGVRSMIITGGTASESAAMAELARKLGMFSTVGCHPTRCKEWLKDPAAYLAQLDDIIEKNRDVVVAVGECGLDYDRTHFCPIDVQKRFFPEHFKLAVKHKLPLFLHDRNTGNDFVEVMRAHVKELPAGGVVHSFTGSVGEMQALAEMGFYFSLNGCSLKTDENLRAAEAIPLDRLILETDAPWCGIRPTHASYELLWPRPKAAEPASQRGRGGRGGGRGGARGAPAAEAPALSGRDALLASHVPLLPPAFPECKPEKFAPGSLVKGRNEPCLISQVFEVVYALRYREVASPQELATIVFNNTQRLFKLPL